MCQGRLVKVQSGRNPVCANCGWVYYNNPLPSVVALVKNHKGDLLLIKRGVEPGKGKWALPSGFIEQDEEPNSAVLRELKEETNVTGTVDFLLGVFNEFTKLYGNVIQIAYKISYLGGRLRPGSDVVEVKFFSQNRLPGLAFASHQRIIETERVRVSEGFVQILKSKITDATITHTQLFYRGSMGIDGKIMDEVGLLPGEKVDVLNYNNGERLQTYTIREKENSGKIILYGPASRKGKVGDKLCILGYKLLPLGQAASFRPRVVFLDERNRVRRRHT
ncbi:aspartate 1-decarboxylase [candidate division WOR-3 bacterium 4484_100]|uniref:Aspartate 1-decarboxylase n=1 Tax=candidate division WOR-3 bacterium 4484_100 TaxID=1936077 RepID=A0A1V4QGK1_UNCW3|nr:MAG: aspartate 1-decarboxylase [candidate division WOR-3 bacterium 4484_100]